MANGIFTLKQQQSANADGTWVLASKTPSVDYLVVAGGGGAGNNGGGGGGAGGLLAGFSPITAGSAYTVTVGTGGATSPSSGVAGFNGGSSAFGAVSSDGGGGGGYGAPGSAGTNGGSGGGGSAYSSGTSFGSGGAGVTGQGNKGGDAKYGSTVNIYDAGGGGAGAPAQNNPGVSNQFIPAGGVGVASAIAGTLTAYAGGGGGYGDAGGFAAPGGAGGGGAGGYSASGAAGTANTGGGGGGNGGAGGSGIVILSYPDIYPVPASTTGSPTVSTSGSGSLAFTGASTNYLSYGGQTPFVFGTGDFTIEFWIYFNSVAGSPILVDWRAGGSNGTFPTFYMNGANMIYYVSGVDAITSSSLSTSTWYHIAVCRTGTATKMYLNGTQTGSTYTDTTNYTANATAPWIGSGSASLNGNITNFRAVKGICVYTGTFTPSTSPLAATQPAGTNIAAITGTQTSLLLNSASGARLADASTNSYLATVTGSVMAWNALSPFSTGLGYKNRVYTWTGNGSVTF